MSQSVKGSANIDKVCRKRKKPPSLIEYANTQRHSGVFNDVVINTGSTSYPVSGLVLACCSPVLEKKIKTQLKQSDGSNVVEIESIDKHSMKCLIDFIYSGSININNENACDLLSSADYLQIEDVKQFCLDYLREALTPENCFTVINLAKQYKSKSLLEEVNSYIAENFNDIVCTKDFKTMSRDELVSFVTKQNRKVVPETSLYKAITSWTKFDEENRATGFHELLRLVKLHKLPTEVLEDVVSRENLVTENLSCSKLLIEAFSSQSKLSRMKDSFVGTRILSLGGNSTASKVICIYNCAATDELSKPFPDLPEPRDCGYAITCNDKVYYIGGRVSSDSETSNKVWCMGIKDKNWKWWAVSPLQVERCVMGAAIFEGRIVVVGGWDKKGAVATGEYYTPSSDTWQDISPLKVARSGNAAVTCQGSLYTMGGFSENKYLSSAERLNSLDGGWENVKSMTTPRRWLAAVQFDDMIYAIGGQSGKNDHSRLKTVEKYDASKNKWTYISDMTFHRSGCSACVLNGKIFVVGGFDIDGTVVKEIETYDPWSDKWEIVGETNDELFHHTIVPIV